MAAHQVCLWGVDASVLMPAGGGCLANAFTYDQTYSAPEAVGFGVEDALVRGAVRRASGLISGVTTYGTTADVPGVQDGGLQEKDPVSLTLTFFTGYTLVFLVVFTGISLRVALESSDQSSYSYTRSGATTQTWPALT